MLLVMLAAAIPADRKVSADLPELSITIEVDEDSIDYETAEATITVSGVNTLPADQRDTWYVSFKNKVKDGGSWSQSKKGVPGAVDTSDRDEIYSFQETGDDGVYEATVKLERYRDERSSTAANSLSHSLTPGKLHVVQAGVALLQSSLQV